MEKKTKLATVYLDSQDFSKFSPSSGDFLQVSQTKNHLLELSRSGKARFVFSDMHVFECFPINDKTRELGIERIREIKRFCQTDSLPSLIQTIEDELRAMTDGDSEKTPRQEWSEWFPNLSISEQLATMEDIFENQQKKILVNRAARRAAKNTTKNTAESIVAEFRKNFPLNEHGTKILVEYFSADRQEAKFREALFMGLRDLPSFAQWVLKEGIRGQEFVNTLRGPAYGIFGAMERLRSNINELFLPKDFEKPGERQVSLRNAFLESAKSWRNSLPKSLAIAILNQQEFKFEPEFSNEITPSLIVITRFLEQLIVMSSVPPSPRKPSPSDFADALHASYLPQVDIFRCDRFAADLIKQALPKYSSKVAPDLMALPNMIEELTNS